MPYRLGASALPLAGVALLAACSTAPREDPIARQARLVGEVLAARYAEYIQDPTEAARHYSAALADAPKDPELIDGAVQASLTANDVARAMEAARRGALQDLGPLTRLTRAVEAINRDRYRAAGEVLAGVNGSLLDRAGARVLSAWALFGRGEREAALAQLAEGERRLAAAGVASLFSDQRGLMLLALGRREEALAAFDANGGAPIRLSAVDLRRGESLERLGRSEEARALYADRLRRGYDARLAAAAARLEAGGAPAEDGVTLGGGAALGLVTFAAALAGDSSPAAYLPYLTLALALDPGADDIRLILAEAQRDLGDETGAARTLRDVAATSPYAPVAQVQTAFLLQAQDKPEEALAAAEQAAASGERFARQALADLHRANERWAEAERVYDDLIRTAESPDWRLFFARGAARERLGRWPEAEADLQRALELAPDEPDVLNYLGYAWVDQGVRLEEGLALIERALTLDPGAAHIIDSMGWAHYRLGNFELALQHLERAVALAPDDPTLNDHLGDLYFQLGRKLEATYQWRRALTLEPPKADQEAISAKLAGEAPRRDIPAEPSQLARNP